MTPARDLSTLLAPRSIVVIGAAQEVDRIGGRPFQLARHLGFTGEMAGVHPRFNDVQGYPCYPTLSSVPFRADLAVIAVGAERVLDVVRDCIANGIPAAIVFAAGFAEAGTRDGRDRQDALVGLAQQSGMLILGPNTLGLVNLRHRAAPSFASAVLESQSEPGGICLIGQSGGACMTVFNTARSRGVSFSSVVMTGNEATLGFVEIAQAALEDPENAAVLGYLEGLDDPTGLRQLAEISAKQSKPLIVYKVGATEAGALAAMSHTARMAGDGRVFKSGLRELNIIRADDLEELSELAYLCGFLGRETGARFGIVTGSGAIGAVLTDKLVAQGAEVPPLSAVLQAELQATGMAYASTRNPVDVSGNIVNSQAGLAATLRVMLHCDALDSVVFFATGAVVDAVAPLLLAEQQATKRLLCVMVTGASEAAQVLERVGIPVFRDISRGAMALAKIGLWNHRRHTKTVPTERIGVSRDTRIVTAIIDRMRAAGRNSLDEYAAKALVSAYGIRTPKEFVVKSPAEALAAVDEIGGPVVMKMLSDAVTHKTELGGVRIGVARPDVARVFGELAELAGDGDQTPGVLVQQQEAAGFELLISSSHDPALGTFITVAAGGVTTELLDDAVYALLPLSENAASDMLKGLRCYPLLTGYRGRPGFGFVAVRDALLAFSDLSTDFGNTIAEVEVNPLIVTAAGVVAVDAVVTLTAARNFRES